MKSIRYMLTGRPHKLEDCLDLARAEPPTEVSLDLLTRHFATDRTVWVEMVAEFRWRFGSRSAVCRDVCGCLTPFDEPDLRAKRLARANAELARTIQRLQSRGIAVGGGARRFVNTGPFLIGQGICPQRDAAPPTDRSDPTARERPAFRAERAAARP